MQKSNKLLWNERKLESALTTTLLMLYVDNALSPPSGYLYSNIALVIIYLARFIFFLFLAIPFPFQFVLGFCFHCSVAEAEAAISFSFLVSFSLFFLSTVLVWGRK